jgi:hypothetical protein
MKTGISRHMHGYDDIDNDSVTVRSEVARLTRLYDRAVRTSTVNSPDMYQNDSGALTPDAALKMHQTTPGLPSVVASTSVPATSVTVVDPDASPATLPPPKKADANHSEPSKDPDASPVTEDPKGKAPAST